MIARVSHRLEKDQASRNRLDLAEDLRRGLLFKREERYSGVPASVELRPTY